MTHEEQTSQTSASERALERSRAWLRHYPAQTLEHLVHKGPTGINLETLLSCARFALAEQDRGLYCPTCGIWSDEPSSDAGSFCGEWDAAGNPCTGELEPYVGQTIHIETFRADSFRSVKMREPVVKIYRSGLRSDSFALATTAANADEFLREAGIALANVADDLLGGEGLLREDGSIAALLPQICAVWAKLSGYKADTVHERRVLVVGEPNPEAHMKWLNAPPDATADPTPEVMATT
jgi:hypothetical protein